MLQYSADQEIPADTLSDNFQMITSTENIEKYSLITGKVVKTYENVPICATEEQCDEDLIRKYCNGLITEVHFYFHKIISIHYYF